MKEARRVRVPREDLDAVALGTLDAAQGEPWAVACSGGADSVLLLHLVLEIYPEQRGSLSVLHFDHCARDASGADALFVKDLADRFGLGFVLGRATGTGQGSEAKFRQERLAFFHREMQARKIRLLLQGHQMDDVAETLLMRLSRGSGLDGLAAPRPVQHFAATDILHVRPLLSLSRSQVRHSLQEAGIGWREDSSNATPRYFRNRIRANIVPALEQAAQQDVLRAMCRSRRLLEEDSIALDHWVDEVLDERADADGLRWPRDLPAAVVRRILHRWLGKQGFDSILRADVMDGLVQSVHQGRASVLSLGHRHRLLCDEELGRIYIEEAPAISEAWAPVRLPVGASLFLPSGGSLCSSSVDVDQQLYSEIAGGSVDPGRTIYVKVAPGPLHIRQRKPGDRCRPLGMQTSVRLQDILVNRKVPAGIRDQLPIVNLPDSDTVLWCPGCPGPEGYKLHGPSEFVLRLDYHPPA